MNNVLLKGKKIAIGVCGGIAVYKACELVRGLKKLGAEIRIVMTPSATRFVTPLTFATLSENPVLLSLFEGTEEQGVPHIDLARWCELLVVCPATANFLGKVASGISDDALTTTILATRAPVMICPAMNSAMWEKPVVQENIARLKKLNYEIVEPAWGPLATTAEGEGWGRLADLPRITHKIIQMLLGSKELAGKKVVVTAGPTREPLDPVRFISNHSTGKMGFAIADAAKLKGAQVVLVSGPTHLPVPPEVKYVEVTTSDEMFEAVNREYKDTDILISAAAVADFKPKRISKDKIKKDRTDLLLELTRTVDILGSLAKKKGKRIHVGFALETTNTEKNARQKLKEKNLDLIVLNNPLEEGAGFYWDTNKVTLIFPDGRTEPLPMRSKFEIALIVLNKVVEMLKNRTKQTVMA